MKRFFAELVFLVITALPLYLVWVAYNKLEFIIKWNSVTGGDSLALIRFTTLIPHLLVLIVAFFWIKKLYSLKSQQDFSAVIIRGIGGIVGGFILFVVLKFVLNIIISIAL